MSLVNLLITDESQVISTIRSIHQSIGGMRLDIQSSFEKARLSLSRSDLVLGIVHITCDSDADKVVQLFDQRQQLELPLPFLFIADSSISPELSLKLLRLGAVDCLRLPFEEGKLRFLIDSLTLRRRFQNNAKAQAISDGNISVLAPQPENRAEFLYESSAMKSVVDKVKRVAELDSVVLLGGETGTGKTRLAKLIHDQSHRSQRPFIHIDCASIPESLIENELFGHQKGAFTGAESQSEGRCAAAKDGTLFLDEIDAVSTKSQATLLRLADERFFTPVGGTHDITLKARLIVGTNRDLADEVCAGRFRKDLYYRLKVLTIDIPPLRFRREDIQPLTKFFVEKVAAQHGTPRPAVDPAVVTAFSLYDWPGNLRELKNTIEQMMTFKMGPTLTIEDLPEAISAQYRKTYPLDSGDDSVLADEDIADSASPRRKSSVSDSWILKRFPEMNSIGIGRIQGEVRAIISALNSTQNNRTLAAEALGISRVALYKKLRRYDLMDFEV